MVDSFGPGRRQVVDQDGRALAFEVRDCRVCLGGEFAGNVDLRIACEPELARTLQQRLALRLPGEPDPAFVLGSGREAGDFAFTFGSDLGDRDEVPDTVTLLWDDKAIDTLPCRLVGSIPLDTGRLLDPAEFLWGADGTSMAPIQRGTWRGPLLSALTLALLGGSAVLAAASVHGHGLVLTSLLGGAAMLGALGLFALVPMLLSYQQLRVDPARGTVETVTGRNVFFVFREQESKLHRAGDFDHVRIVERLSTGSHDSDPQSIWLVGLEGPIRWEGDAPHIDIHMRPDGLHLGEFGSQLAARRFAARVGRALGLRILDTSVTQD